MGILTWVAGPAFLVGINMIVGKGCPQQQDQEQELVPEWDVLHWRLSEPFFCYDFSTSNDSTYSRCFLYIRLRHFEFLLQVTCFYVRSSKVHIIEVCVKVLFLLQLKDTTQPPSSQSTAKHYDINSKIGAFRT
jgi:hypothetical protein